ncbi:hypothetical protein [Microvirga arabica]|uniref:hypothetical protein n=1 Tax=Microvirga arabica TaxID=1128671 RepID=UPI001939796D|nr:hypothetical protein [Microvirga arabica]MBM1171290.1 hypothetical protein [Microvirga arabica]
MEIIEDEQIWGSHLVLQQRLEPTLSKLVQAWESLWGEIGKRINRRIRQMRNRSFEELEEQTGICIGLVETVPNPMPLRRLIKARVQPGGGN